jgi:hypothetical protein
MGYNPIARKSTVLTLKLASSRQSNLIESW